MGVLVAPVGLGESSLPNFQLQGPSLKFFPSRVHVRKFVGDFLLGSFYRGLKGGSLLIEPLSKFFEQGPVGLNVFTGTLEFAAFVLSLGTFPVEGDALCLQLFDLFGLPLLEFIKTLLEFMNEIPPFLDIGWGHVFGGGGTIHGSGTDFQYGVGNWSETVLRGLGSFHLTFRFAIWSACPRLRPSKGCSRALSRTRPSLNIGNK